ncbi:MAG: TlpA disulfide reductase family protein [Desulfuromonadaceae bacterium]|nr:TlpA disulfide reductase family protein [Desulfuromonadaceae bacterium]MDD5104530.1 TlpA disulfide reductase family protein [Desulfuromonadaceae bacterium]
MKFVPLFVRILLIFIAASSLVTPVRVDAAPRKGQPAPNFTVISTTGQSISPNNYHDHVLILDFFATWCQPCRQSIPHLVEMNRKYGKQGLQILGLSVDGDGDKMVKAFSDDLRINYPVAVAGDQVTVDFGVRSVPIMFLIDKKGEIVEIYRGYTSDMGRSIDQAIRRLLAER